MRGKGIVQAPAARFAKQASAYREIPLQLTRIFHEGNGISGESGEEGWTNITNAIASSGLSDFVQDSKPDCSENHSGTNCTQ